MSEKLEVEFIERSATRSQKMINDELLSEPEALFELADREFSEKKLAHRVSAILAAQKQKAKLERLLALVNADLLKAKKGNFISLVEQYVSVQVAEEYE